MCIRDSTTIVYIILLRELHASNSKKVVESSETQKQLTLRIEVVLGEKPFSDVEFAIIEEVMQFCNHNKSLAAQKLSLA